jgi:glycosyltransferase involved in cell wall biosynthesis
MKNQSSAADPRVAIIGTAGVPAAYGGFETLADELIQYAEAQGLSHYFTVYCSGSNKSEEPSYRGAYRRFISLSANGIASIFYDMLSCIDAWWRGERTFLILGVSGAPIIPFLRLVSSVKVVTNVDGVEWKRAKWGRIASLYLRVAEWVAVRFSHDVISDNKGIKEYLDQAYGRESTVITYGGDHALRGDLVKLPFELPEVFALSLCRIEPENNVHEILSAFSRCDRLPLVFVGNWDATDYGRQLWAKYKDSPNVHLLPPIYEQNRLYSLRHRAAAYVHGHSAGGTNPSLVEMMHFGVPVLAFDCVFNRYSTEEVALYFASSDELLSQLDALLNDDEVSAGKHWAELGDKMKQIAQSKYVWSEVGERYFSLLAITSRGVR